MITSAVQTFEMGAASPSFVGGIYYSESQSPEGSWVQNVGARGLFVAQAIVSIAMLPLNLIAMTFGSALALCFEGSEAAWVILDKTSRFELVHLALIPTGLIGAFAPESAIDMKNGLLNWV
jgi:hypothetical protein